MVEQLRGTSASGRNDAITNSQDEKAAEKFTGGNALELVAYPAGASSMWTRASNGAACVEALGLVEGNSVTVRETGIRELH
jgi:hypothetical protein